MTTSPSDTGQWIAPLGDVYLGLDRDAVIQRVLGTLNRQPAQPVTQIEGLTWRQFVETYADPAAHKGLDWGWQAIIEGCVAPPHWPAMLPFAEGMIARVRPAEHDSLITAVVHVRADRTPRVNATLDSVIRHVLERMGQLTQQLLAGIAGPLTDMQVAHTRGIAHSILHTRQFLEQLSAGVFSLAVIAPAPHRIAELFLFGERDFVDRRIVTHRLRLENHWSDEKVYCLAGLRETMQQVIGILFQRITEESAIQLRDRVADDGQTCLVSLHFHSRDPELRADERVLPLGLAEMEELGVSRIITRLVTALDARLCALNGRAWAEPSTASSDATSIELIIPRWLSDSSAS